MNGYHPKMQAVLEKIPLRRAGLPVARTNTSQPGCGDCPKKKASGKPCGDCGKAKPREVYEGLVDPLQGGVDPKRDRNHSVSHEAVWDHINALQLLADGPVPPCPERSGDGVIICGEGRYASMLGMAVRSLRRAGWDGTIEAWYRSSVGGVEAACLDGLGVTLVDADAVVAALPCRQKPRMLSGWALKTFAAVRSRLRRVFQLDADTICLINPTPLFTALDEAPHVYWQDHSNFVRGPWHGLSKAEINSVPSVNSGHMLLDIPARWHELLIARWMDDHEDHWCDRQWQPRHKLHQWGDQDSHRVSSAYKGSRVKVIGPAKLIAKSTAFLCEWEGSPAIVHNHGRKFWAGSPPKRDDSIPSEILTWELYAEVKGRVPSTSPRFYAHGMTKRQYDKVVVEITRRAPCRVLIFGAGNDTQRYVQANPGGRTVVLEDQPEWLVISRKARAETYPVSYTTRAEDGLVHPCPPLEVPPSVLAERFDVVLIDGPSGSVPNSHGRQQPVELASRLISSGGVIFAHDWQTTPPLGYSDASCYVRHLGVPDEVVTGPPDLAVYRRELT